MYCEVFGYLFSILTRNRVADEVGCVLNWLKKIINKRVNENKKKNPENLSIQRIIDNRDTSL